MTQQVLLNIPDQLYQTLLQIAQKRGESLENLAIECLNEFENKSEEIDPLEQFIGAFNSNNLDWVENHDYYIGKSIIESNHNQVFKKNIN